MLIIQRQCLRDLDDFPQDTKGELTDAIALLELGHKLSMHLPRSMPSIGKGVDELRFRDRSGIYRVIYYLAGAGMIYLLHAFVKKTRETPKQNIEIAKKRLREVIKMKKTSSQELSKKLGITPARAMEAIIKAQLISAVIKAIAKERMTHTELAKRSGLSRSVVTGILSGSLQKITIDRVLRLVEAANLVAEVRVKEAA